MGDHPKDQSSSILYGSPEGPQHAVRLDDREERLLLAATVDGFRTLLAEVDSEHRREDSRAHLRSARRYCELLEMRLHALGKGSDLRQLNEWNPEGRIYEELCAGIEEAARVLQRRPPRTVSDGGAFSLLVGAYIELKGHLEKIESRASTREAYWLRWSDDRVEGNAPDWDEAEGG